MTPCRDCDPPDRTPKDADLTEVDAEAPTHSIPLGPGSQANAPGPDTLIALEVVGLAHGILFLSAPEKFRDVIRETAVEPATPFMSQGQREGTVVRVEASRTKPMVVVQLDPRAPFRVGPYRLVLRKPLLRSATRSYAVDVVTVAE